MICDQTLFEGYLLYFLQSMILISYGIIALWGMADMKQVIHTVSVYIILIGFFWLFFFDCFFLNLFLIAYVYLFIYFFHNVLLFKKCMMTICSVR